MACFVLFATLALLAVATCSALETGAATTDLNFVSLNDATESISSVAFSPDLKLFASSSEAEANLWGAEGMVRLYSLGDGVVPSLKYTLNDTRWDVNSVAFSTDSKLLAVGAMCKQSYPTHSGCEVHVYSLGDGCKPTLKYTLNEATDAINSVVFSPDSKLLATGSSDGKVRVYSLVDGVRPSLKYILDDATDKTQILSVAFSADLKFIASGSFEDKMVRVYSLEDGVAPRLKYTFKDAKDRVSSVAFSADSKLLACGSYDGKVRVYTLDAPQTSTLTLVATDSSCITSVAFSADSKLLASASTCSTDWKVRVYSLGDGVGPTLKYSLNDATGGVQSLAFSADSKLLASGSRDNKARVYYGLGLNARPTSAVTSEVVMV